MRVENTVIFMSFVFKVLQGIIHVFYTVVTTGSISKNFSLLKNI